MTAWVDGICGSGLARDGITLFLWSIVLPESLEGPPPPGSVVFGQRQRRLQLAQQPFAQVIAARLLVHAESEFGEY